jgi:AcrR family transcriptional regulator
VDSPLGQEHGPDVLAHRRTEQGYSGVSIEAVANAAGVTRPVVYDHFPNLARLLHALVEREEIYALEERFVSSVGTLVWP